MDPSLHTQRQVQFAKGVWHWLLSCLRFQRGAIADAWREMYELVFENFTPARWLCLTLVVFLIQMGISSIGDTLYLVWFLWISGDTRALPTIVLEFVFSISILLLQMWLSAQGRMVFVSQIAHKQIRPQNWHQLRMMGHRLFFIQLGVVLLSLVFIFLPLQMLWMRESEYAFAVFVPLLLGIVTFVGLIVMTILNYLLPVAMLARQVDAPSAMRILLRKVLWRRPGHVWVSLLLVIIASHVVMSVVAHLLNLFVLKYMPYGFYIWFADHLWAGWISRWIPTAVTALILVPYFVLAQGFLIKCIQQISPIFLIATDSDFCRSCGYDLRGNPDATHCSECGEEIPRLVSSAAAPTSDQAQT